MSAPELLSGFGARSATDHGFDALDAAPAGARHGDTRILVWDLPLRIFHWSLVASVTAAVVTAEIGGPWMAWHGRAGLLIIGLVVFRLVWGLIGSTTARFTSFAPSPGRVRRYLRGQWRGVGHNPLGALSVFALLGLLSVQGLTGLFGNDDIAFAGPLNHLVGDALGTRLTGWHRLLADALFVLMGLHIGAIAFYLCVRRKNLVRTMVTGRHDLDPASSAPVGLRQGSRRALLWAVSVAAAVVLTLAWVGRTPPPVAAAKVAPVVAPAW